MSYADPTWLCAAHHLKELDSSRTCSYGVSTLERWQGRYRKGGLEALRPGRRARGHALALTSEQRDLLIEIRREYRGCASSFL